MTIAEWRRRLWNSGFLRSLAALLSAGVFSHAILLATMPLVARLYDPVDFGVLAVFISILTPLLVASSFRYDLAIPLPRSDKDSRVLLLLALLMNFAVSVCVMLGVVACGKWIADIFRVPQLVSVLWILPVTLIGAGTYRSYRMWAVRRRDFKAVARTRITQAVAGSVVQIGFGLAGIGALGLAMGQLVGFSAGTMRLARGSWISRNELRSATLWRRMRILARRYDRFPKYDVLASLINSVSLFLPALLLPVFFRPEVAGFYMLADRAMAAPLSLLSQSIGQLVYSRSPDAVRNNRIGYLTIRVLLGLSLTLSIPTLIIVFFGTEIFIYAFGGNWAEAGVYASWLIIGIMIQQLYSSVSLVLLATNAQNLNLQIQVGQLLAKAGALYYGYYMGSAFVAIAVFSVTNALVSVLAIAAVVYHANKDHSEIGGVIPERNEI